MNRKQSWPPHRMPHWRAAQGTAVYSESRLSEEIRLGHTGCTSIRDSRPVGESVDYDFNGKSNLILMGPNGSGK